MSRTLRAVLIFFALSQCLLRAQVPDVDQVLQHFVSALGGQQELEKIRTMTLRGTMEFPDFKTNGTTAEYFKYPDHFAAVTDIPGHGSTQLVYDGHEGFQVDPRNGFTQISGADLADIHRRANIHWDLKLHEFYPNLRVTGHEMVNGEDAWKLEASLENSTFDFFFSMKTGLLIRFDTDQHVQNGTSSVSISDYRSVDKVLFAFGAAQTAGPVKWTRKLTEVRFNEPIDDSVFARPEKPAK
jgi:zinc protease